MNEVINQVAKVAAACQSMPSVNAQATAYAATTAKAAGRAVQTPSVVNPRPINSVIVPPPLPEHRRHVASQFSRSRKNYPRNDLFRLGLKGVWHRKACDVVDDPPRLPTLTRRWVRKLSMLLVVSNPPLAISA